MNALHMAALFMAGKSRLANRLPISSAAMVLLAPFLALQTSAAFKDDNAILKKLNAGHQNEQGVFEATRIKRKDKNGVEREVEQRRTRSGEVAKSQKSAIVIEDILELAVPESPEEAKSLDGTDAGVLGSQGLIEYYDQAGVLKWKRSLSQKKAAMHPRRISDGGEIASIIETCEMNCWTLPADQRLNQLVVWDAAGNEQIRFPRTRGSCVVSPTNHWVSQDGRYVLAACSSRSELPGSIIIDVRGKRSWRSPALLNVIVSKPLGPRKVLVQMIDEERKRKAVELDFKKLAWEPLE